MLAILFGIEGAKVLKFVEDEEAPAFAILMGMPLAESVCPTRGGPVRGEDLVTEELPPTMAGFVERGWHGPYPA